MDIDQGNISEFARQKASFLNYAVYYNAEKLFEVDQIFEKVKRRLCNVSVQLLNQLEAKPFFQYLQLPI